MPYGPGKFEGEPASTFLLYQISLNQSQDEEFSHESFGWWAKFEGKRFPDGEGIRTAKAVGYTDAEIDEGVLLLQTMAGAILHETDQGFVSADIWNQNGLRSLNQAWLDIQLEFAEETVE